MTSKVCRSLVQVGSLAAACFLTACAGPERAPHQPIQGIDTPDVKVDNPHDKVGGTPSGTAVATPVAPTPPPVASAAPTEAPPSGTPAGASPKPAAMGFLDAFVQKVTAAHRAAPGVVAVFPALARSGEGNQRVYAVNGLGEWLMEETAAGLEREGVRGILAGGSLIGEIKASNRGLDALRGLDDVSWLADRIGAGYVVMGTAQHRTYDLRNRDEAIEIVWECRRLPDRSVVATLREEATQGPLVQQLARRLRGESTWRIGAEAPQSQPSLDAELRWVAGILAQRVADKHAKVLAGKSVRVMPAVFRQNAGVGADLQAFADQWERSFATAERKLAGGEVANAEVAALEAGPVTIAGKPYDSHGAALDAFRAQWESYKSSPAGGLAVDVSRLLTERLRAASGDGFRVLSDDGDRGRLLSIVRSEARAHRLDGAMDERTIATMRANGTDLVLEPVLRPALKTYRLSFVLRDLRTAEEIPESIDIDEQFHGELDRLLGK